LAQSFVNGVKQNLELMSQGIVNEVICLVEQRRVMPKFRPQQTAHNITLNAGHNTRLNVNSVDQSVNVVSITEQNIFKQMRDIIRSKIPEQEQMEILQRLEAMEAAVSKPTFRERYREWISVAADHLALFQFCIPVLVSMAQRYL
jgi:hypothetical protein